MHTLSQPVSDRDEAPPLYLTGDALRKAVKETGQSNSQVAKGIGKSDTMISQWRNGIYKGDIAGLESALREWLRDRLIVAVSGVASVETEISKAMQKRFEEIRTNRELGVMVGPAGIGKSRGNGLYLKSHALAIGFRALPWHRGVHALALDLSNAASIFRLEKGKKRWDTLLEKTAGSGRLLIVDDGQELCPGALQAAVDYHEETGNGVCITGLPSLRQKLLKDTRRARRVGDFYELHVEKPLPLVEHLIGELAPDANGETGDLTALCLQVVAMPGAFGAVEKQLKHAARARRKTTGLGWAQAFRAAHKRLLRRQELEIAR